MAQTETNLIYFNDMFEFAILRSVPTSGYSLVTGYKETRLESNNLQVWKIKMIGIVKASDITSDSDAPVNFRPSSSSSPNSRLPDRLDIIVATSSPL